MDKYIETCYKEFKKSFIIGGDYNEPAHDLNLEFQYGGAFGLYDPVIIKNKYEYVRMVDFTGLRNWTVCFVFINKRTHKIRKILKSSKFWNEYNGFLKRGYLEVGNNYKRWKRLRAFGL